MYINATRHCKIKKLVILAGGLFQTHNITVSVGTAHQ